MSRGARISPGPELRPPQMEEVVRITYSERKYLQRTTVPLSRCPTPPSHDVSRGHAHVRAAENPPNVVKVKMRRCGQVTNKATLMCHEQEVTHIHAHVGVLVSTFTQPALPLSH